MDVVSVLEKKRLDVRGVEVITRGVQREEEHPHYYKTIDIEYVVTGVGVPDDAVARAIELSEQKYCSVKGMFGPQVSVTTRFRVVEPAQPGPSAPKAGE
jgi:putative redox protein